MIQAGNITCAIISIYGVLQNSWHVTSQFNSGDPPGKVFGSYRLMSFLLPRSVSHASAPYAVLVLIKGQQKRTTLVSHPVMNDENNRYIVTEIIAIKYAIDTIIYLESLLKSTSSVCLVQGLCGMG
jgi:hypothetical protein